VEFNFNKAKPYKLAEGIITSTTEILVNHRFFFVILVIGVLITSVFQLNRIKIDNYLLDELNPSSEFYQDSKFIDENFGGIKPVSIFIDFSEIIQFKKLDFINHLDSLHVSVDFSNETEQKRKLYKYLFKDQSAQLKYNCRISDIGSYASNNLYKEIGKFDDKNDIHFTGIGYLFDTTSDMLTKKLLIGLLFAIITVGTFLCLAFGFNLKLFFIGITPNILPLVATLGIVSFFSSFYLCLSNAFIFTVAFGLIIDDSIHIINSFMHHNNQGLNKSEIMNNLHKKTANTILKTTSIVIVCLIPLLFSEFKSVSQLAMLTIIASCFAIIFDIGILPTILSKLIKSKTKYQS
jgi:uncharacterized protein